MMVMVMIIVVVVITGIVVVVAVQMMVMQEIIRGLWRHILVVHQSVRGSVTGDGGTINRNVSITGHLIRKNDCGLSTHPLHESW